MKMNIVFWNSDVHSKISYLLIWYWVKQFLFEWRHKWTLHFEHFQYVFPEHCSFLHLVLFTADTNIGQWSNPSYLKSFGTLDADSRVFFRGGSFSSSLRLSLEIELVEYNISSSELSLSISFDIFELFNKYDEREIEVSVLFIARRYLLFVLLHHMIYICLVFSFLSHMLGIFFLSYTWDFFFFLYASSLFICTRRDPFASFVGCFLKICDRLYLILRKFGPLWPNVLSTGHFLHDSIMYP